MKYTLPEPKDAALIMLSKNKELIGQSRTCGEHVKACSDCGNSCHQKEGCLLTGDRVCLPRAWMMKITPDSDFKQQEIDNAMKRVDPVKIANKIMEEQS